MATQYTPEELKYLRDSPLVIKPPELPPIEQWMGAPAESTRNNNSTRLLDRTKKPDSDTLLDQINRRPQHVSRNSKDPGDIILGPPKTAFLSATSTRSGTKNLESSDRPSLRDSENSKERFSFRGKTGDGEDERPQRSTLRPRRADGEAGVENGWQTVSKDRKSFGTEGAERFNGRMGGGDRIRDDRRFKDREEREVRDRPQRGFDSYTREKDSEHEHEKEPRRNGIGRGRGESWRDNDAPPTPRDRNSNGDRLVDRTRGWREKERDDRDQERDRGDRGVTRNERGDRRWDRNNRDDRQEREPEWMDEPSDGKTEAHTQEDFKKWKDSMRKDHGGGQTPAEEVLMKVDVGGSFFGLEKLKVETPLAVDTGPDKFFGNFMTPKDEVVIDFGKVESKKEGVAKTGTSSRFTSFFKPKEEPPRAQQELPPTPAAPPPRLDLFGGSQAIAQGNGQNPDDDKLAFQRIMQQLYQPRSGSSTTPPSNMQQQPPASAPLPEVQNLSLQSPEPFQPPRNEHPQERPSTTSRNSQHALQDLLNPRHNAAGQHSVRPEQMLQDLVGQRQLAQPPQRPESQARNAQTQFLMDLMIRNTPAEPPQRIEQTLLNNSNQRQGERPMLRDQILLEREQEMHRDVLRERNTHQRPTRPQGPPSFYEEPPFQRGPPPPHERHGNPPQPTQILQRPPPPGLSQQMQPSWAQSPAELGPQQIRQQPHIAPPPGLNNGPGRGMPMPQMFPPGFQGMPNFPDGRMPPPGFFNPPPPPFMPPGMNGFPGPDSMAYGGQYDGRGPPPSAYRR